MIAENLESDGIVRSAAAVKFYSFITGVAHQLKPGMYTLSPSDSSQRIIRSLVSGLPRDVSVLIIEGATTREIDQLLAEHNILEPGELISFPWTTLRDDYPFLITARDLEGFLFPDTYRFFPHSQPEDVVRKLLDGWKQNVWPFLEFYQNQRDDGRNFYNKLILASLLEKEIPFFEDRQIVTGILEKRLHLGIALQVDATVIYAICDKQFKGCPQLSLNDLQFDSPFNTYVSRGLPPTPIGNPGVQAIRAALSPVPSDYFFYISDPKTKRTIFAETLDEHARNRRTYLISS